MAIGHRIKDLRQEKGWSQAQFADKLKTHPKQISKYERGINLPSTEVLIRLTQIFNVSADFLIFEDHDEKEQGAIADHELVQKMSEIDKLPEQDKAIVKGVLDAFIIKNRFQQLAAIDE
ncbi:MAG: helix-turn-helix transcriptional regulator [Desulfobacteraceae bacterium]|jgi:transcriptional regulator with XRE-family HTH domain